MNADHNRTFGAQNFCTNIVAIECVTTHFDIAECPTYKAHVDDGIVNVADRLQDLANKD